MTEWSFLHVNDVTSTQVLAKKLGGEGSPEGTVVVARRQSAGRGRMGRHWASPEGGLYLSILLRPPERAEVETLTLLAALAVVRGIEHATGLKTLIRWPNDIVVGGRKIAGVIAESSFSGRRLSFVVIGVGVNCNAKIPPARLKGNKATSLFEELGTPVEFPRILQSILSDFGDLYELWRNGADIVERARGLVGTVGKKVEVKLMSRRRLQGRAAELTEMGCLLVKRGRKKVILRPEDIELIRES